MEHLRLKEKELYFAVEYGITFPSPALRMELPLGVKGYLTPSCKVAEDDPDKQKWCQEPGWVLVPKLSVLASWGSWHVLTVKLDGAVGILLSGERGAPLDTLPYLDLLFAPVFNTYRIHLGVRYDRALLDWFRLIGEVNLYVVGDTPEPERNPWTFAGYIGLDFRLGDHSRLNLGCTYYNSDQREVKLEPDGDGYSRFVPVRSHDFLPWIDLIFVWTL